MRTQPKPRKWRFAVATVSLALVAILGACGSDDPVTSDPVFALDRQVTTGIEAVDPNRTDVLPAHLVRSVLQDLLTEHSDLSVEVMRQAVDGDIVDASLDELTRNTDELTLTIGLVYGRDGAEAFDQLWTNHIEFFNDYAEARGSGDEQAADEAIGALDHYESDFSSYIDTATSGNADFHAVLHVLHSHISQLLDQADAWAAGDYGAATAQAVEAHRHMDVIANALATGIAIQQPEAFPGDVAAAEATRCALLQLDASTLVSLLGSAAEAARSGSGGAAAEAAVPGVRAGIGAADLDEIDRALADTDFSSANARGEARDTVRAALAAGDCNGWIAG